MRSCQVAQPAPDRVVVSVDGWLAAVASEYRLTWTILGSGTVSNEDRSRGISCLAERRMIEIIEEGKPTTPFLKAGDCVRIELLDEQGASIFGAIDQKVTT